MTAVAGQMRGDRGFTLIELVITIALIALVVSIIVPAANSISGVNLRMSASQLAGCIRFTYDLAARKSTVFRVAFDLDNQTYWVESASAKYLLDREKDKIQDGKAESDEEKARKQRRRFVTRSSIETGEMWEPKKQTSFTDFAGPLTKKVKLPGEAIFHGVWVGHQTDRVTSGMAYLYCFPTGMTERAVITVAEGESDFFSLQVDALDGHVKLTPGLVDVPEE